MIVRKVKYFYCSDFEHLENTLDGIVLYLSSKNLTIENILLLTVFIKSVQDDFPDKRNQIKQILKVKGFDIPHLVVAQPPFESQIVIEVLWAEGKFDILNSNNQYKLIRHTDAMELFAVASTEFDAQSTEQMFSELNDVINHNEFEINQIVRQWNYIGDIIGFNNGEQNYQKFNNDRSKFYQNSEWLNGYPAATGIGTNAGGVSVCIHAVKPAESIKIVPLKNPNQQDAHKYSDNVLIGSNSKTTPKFERGKAVISNEISDIFISGTAAIQGEHVVNQSDAENQTVATIENIDTLVKRCKLTDAGIAEIDNRIQYSNVRIYIKNEEDYVQIHQICNQHYPNTEIIYLKADICREELLVEIEANIFDVNLCQQY